MRILALAGAYLCLALLSLCVGFLEAVLIGEFRPPYETYGGLVALVMILAILPLSSLAGIYYFLREVFFG